MSKRLRLEFVSRAAMVGLLASIQTACTESTKSEDDSSEGKHSGELSSTGGANSANPSGSGGFSSDPEPSSGGTDGTKAGTGGDIQSGQGGLGDGGAGGLMGVLSAKVIPDLTLEEFTEMCDEVEGIVETHAVCHGQVTGPGFSYDSDSDEFTEHTCAGYNTCAGFSCVVPE